jgi:RHS repeat-associated protein
METLGAGNMSTLYVCAPPYNIRKQEYTFDRVGNMRGKLSRETVSTGNLPGANLNYALDYEYYAGTHRAKRIGTMYYDYDGNGNVVAEREGGHASALAGNDGEHPLYEEDGITYTDYGFGVVRPGIGGGTDDGIYQRNYRWNERNQLTESRDGAYSVHYRYGADGERAVKYNATTGEETLYFNRMWQMRNGEAEWVQSKHIYVGETRIGTKYNSEGNENTGAERERLYYYHGDHLGSAQVVTNHAGQLYERLEYTPYGETWIEWKNPGLRLEEAAMPYRFTGKELDAETGLYYYGARYLDPKTSRWLSADPAMGDYLPGAPVDDAARRRNGALPGQGGVFNLVNLHVYHYAGNNPIKYIDPDGRLTRVLTDQEWQTVQVAIDTAVQGLDSMINELNDYASGKTAILSSEMEVAAMVYLGVDTMMPAYAEMVSGALGEIRNDLLSKTRDNYKYSDFVDFFGLKNSPNTFADTNIFTGNTRLGPKFFKPGQSGNDTQAGILIHESSHRWSVLFTNDRAYGTTNARNLPISDSNLKIRNADNWEYFYERLKTGGR